MGVGQASGDYPGFVGLGRAPTRSTQKLPARKSAIGRKGRGWTGHTRQRGPRRRPRRRMRQPDGGAWRFALKKNWTQSQRSQVGGGRERERERAPQLNIYARAVVVMDVVRGAIEQATTDRAAITGQALQLAMSVECSWCLVSTRKVRGGRGGLHTYRNLHKYLGT